MKRYRIYLFTLILAVSFLIPSGSVLAKDGWTPQPLPAASIDTVFGDSRYIDPEWMTRRVNTASASALPRLTFAVRVTVSSAPSGRVTLPAALKGLPEDGYALLAVVDAGTEPTNHFLRDMAASAADFEAEGAPLRFFFKDGSKFRPSDFRPFPSTLAFEAEGGQALAARLAEELELVNPDNLPLVLVVNGRGEVVFLSQGYSIGLGAQVLKQLK